MPANSAGDLSWGWRERDPSKGFGDLQRSRIKVTARVTWWLSMTFEGQQEIFLWLTGANISNCHFLAVWGFQLSFGPVAYPSLMSFFLTSRLWYLLPKVHDSPDPHSKTTKQDLPAAKMNAPWVWYTYINFNHNNQPNVGKYIAFMDLMMGCTYLVHKPDRLDPDKVPHQTVPSRHDQPWPSRHWVLLFHRSASSFGLRILRLVGLDSHSWCWGRIWHTTSTAWMPQEVSNWWANGL